MRKVLFKPAIGSANIKITFYDNKNILIPTTVCTTDTTFLLRTNDFFLKIFSNSFASSWDIRSPTPDIKSVVYSNIKVSESHRYTSHTIKSSRYAKKFVITKSKLSHEEKKNSINHTV
jgi:hypothetical protein